MYETLALSELATYRTGGTIHVIVEQPDRLHRRAVAVPLHAVPERHRQEHPGADLPRERRRPRGVRARREARDRVPPAVQGGRDHRPGLLPAARPQRGATTRPTRSRSCTRRSPRTSAWCRSTPIGCWPRTRSTRPRSPSSRSSRSAGSSRRSRRAPRTPSSRAPRATTACGKGSRIPSSTTARPPSRATRSRRSRRALVEAPRRLPRAPEAAAHSSSSARARSSANEPIDWGTAEALAFGTLLAEGIPVRMTGQDVRARHLRPPPRGAARRRERLDLRAARQARHRRRALHDRELARSRKPAVLGFEYGYSTVDPNRLAMWEAQFGDFANSAQVIIDQFIASGEKKWSRSSGLVHAPAARLRGQGARALERAPRALPAALRRGQPAGREPLDARRSTSTRCAARSAATSASRWS